MKQEFKEILFYPSPWTLLLVAIALLILGYGAIIALVLI